MRPITSLARCRPRRCFRRAPRLQRLGRLGREPARARSPCSRPSRRGLVDLVGDRGRGSPMVITRETCASSRALFAAHGPFAQCLLGALALADVARERGWKRLPPCRNVPARISTGNVPVLAPMQRLERDRLAGLGALGEARDGRLIERGVEIPRAHSDQLLAAVAGLWHACRLTSITVSSASSRKKRPSRGRRTCESAPRWPGSSSARRRSGHIDHEADHAPGSAAGVEEHAAFRLQPVHAAILVNHPVLGRDIARFLRTLDRELHRRPVVGMDELLPAPVRPIEGARLQAIHRLEVGDQRFSLSRSPMCQSKATARAAFCARSSMSGATQLAAR